MTQIGEDVVLTQNLAFGTMQWGDTWLDGLLNRCGVVDADVLQNIVHVSVQAGVGLLDTADGYGGGSSEERVCAALEAEDSSGDIAVCTKFLPTLWRMTRGSFFKALRLSMERLRVERVGLYFLHTPMHPRFELFVDCLADAANMGLIGGIGLSNCGVDHIRRAHAIVQAKGQRIACNQILVNLLAWKSAELQATLSLCKELDIVVLGFSPIAQGLLTEGLTRESIKNIRSAMIQRISYEDLTQLRATIALIARNTSKSMAQVCLNWSMCKGIVPLVGVRSVAHATSATGALGWQLTDEQVGLLDSHALAKSTLEKSRLRRSLFLVAISVLTGVYNVLRFFTWSS